jgi:hypothetical protein
VPLRFMMPVLWRAACCFKSHPLVQFPPKSLAGLLCWILGDWP